jgi:hypothetical protein
MRRNGLVLNKITENVDAFTPTHPAMTLGDIQQATVITHAHRAAARQQHGFSRHARPRWGSHSVEVSDVVLGSLGPQGLDVLAIVNPVLKEIRGKTTETACFFTVEGVTPRPCQGSRIFCLPRCHRGTVSRSAGASETSMCSTYFVRGVRPSRRSGFVTARKHPAGAGSSGTAS